ncbi:Zinc finger and SCAN domain-containing 22, partial [Paramuricea clavata]
DALNRHMKTHSDKDHECSRCHKTFNRKDALNRYVRMHEQRRAQREYTCNICGEVFRNIFPLQAHQHDVHQVGRGKRTKLPTRRAKRQRTDEPEPTRSSTRVNEGASTSAVVNEGPQPFPQDPLLPPSNLPSQLHREHWRAIRTRQSRGNRVQDWYNYRLSSLNMGQLVNDIDRIFEDQSTVFKLNLSFGFVLFNNETEQMQYHHPSANNNRVFDSPFQINNRDDLVQVRTALENIDIHEWANKQRPNSKWIVMDITNVTFYVTKLRDHPIGRSVRLPKYVLENPAIVSLDCDKNTGLPYEDKLCFFRCLALHRGCHSKNLERDTQHFYEQYDDSDDFDGVTLEELPELEKLFELNIYVYRLTELHDEDDATTSFVAQLIQRSHRRYANSMYLNLYDVENSESLKPTRANLRGDSSSHFPGGVYKVPQSIFDLLADEGIEIPEDLKYFPYRATFDFECYFKRETEHPRNTAKLTWEAEHIPLSVSVCSNVPGYDQPKCFVSSGSTSEMIQQFVEYLVKISQESYVLLLDLFADVFRQIEERVNQASENEEVDEPNSEEQLAECPMGLDNEEREVSDGEVVGDEVNEDEAEKTHPLEKLVEKLELYLMELPVIGFISGKYDINAAKNPFFSYLVKHEQVKFVIKRNNNHMCLKTQHLKFLDITNYLAPGFSYEQFLKAYECSQTKGYFPYEWVDSLGKLNNPTLPPRETFHSNLSGTDITEEQYEYCERVWNEQNMKTFRDFLVWYNNLDVVPFLEAVQKMSNFWQERNIDMFKDGVSVPGLTMKYLFSNIPDTYFSLFSDKDKDMYYTMKDNNVGGPSIIFNRYHEEGKTSIRKEEMRAKGKESKPCKNVVGYDANALYLWAIMQNMPTGQYTRRLEEDGFKKRWSGKMAIECLEWKANQRRIQIRHEYNNTEKRIGTRRLPVDGFHAESQTVFQFHGSLIVYFILLGCYWHGHNCQLNEGKEVNEKRDKPMKELLEETKRNSAYITKQGFNLVECWECEWRDMKKRNSALQRFIATHLRRPLDKLKTMTKQSIINAVKNDKLFGCVECDIHVPESLREYFKEMCPIFKNTEIRREDIGEFMKSYAEENNIMPRPRRSLIGSMIGKKIMLATPLLKWYLEHGLEVTHVYQIVEYTPKPCFKPFGDAVSDARRAGDADPSKAIIADTMKLVGN